MSYHAVGSDASDSLTFDAGVALARVVLSSLKTSAMLLMKAGASASDIDVGQKILNYANTSGPVLLAKAISEHSVKRIEEVQRQVRELNKIASSTIQNAVVDRFLYAVIQPWNPSAVTDSAAEIEKIKEEIRDYKLPTPYDIPWYVYAGGGVVSLFALAYLVRSFK